MTPDELVVVTLERLAKARTDFTVENYAATRAAAERLLRTLNVIPDEPPRQIEPPRCEPQTPRYVMPNPALAAAVSSPVENLPVYRRGQDTVSYER